MHEPLIRQRLVILSFVLFLICRGKWFHLLLFMWITLHVDHASKAVTDAAARGVREAGQLTHSATTRILLDQKGPL